MLHHTSHSVDNVGAGSHEAIADHAERQVPPNIITMLPLRVVILRCSSDTPMGMFIIVEVALVVLCKYQFTIAVYIVY